MMMFSLLQVLGYFHSSSMALAPRLEIEFADEEGTGSGPTLEFYAEVSRHHHDDHRHHHHHHHRLHRLCLVSLVVAVGFNILLVLGDRRIDRNERGEQTFQRREARRFRVPVPTLSRSIAGAWLRFGATKARWSNAYDAVVADGQRSTWGREHCRRRDQSVDGRASLTDARNHSVQPFQSTGTTVRQSHRG